MTIDTIQNPKSPQDLLGKIQNGVAAPERTLISNGYTLSSAPNRLGWLEPTDPALPFSTLREQFAAQGYL